LQTGLFDTGAPPAVPAMPPDPALQALAQVLDRRYENRLHLGTSSWTFPGWQGSVWARQHSKAALVRHGLPAYASHPLLRCVCLDRAFHRALDSAEFTALAAQVDSGFRFVVKAPALVCDAQLRDPASGRALGANPHFLDADAACRLVAEPAAQGLGGKLGVLVFQLSPLSRHWLDDAEALHERLADVWRSVRPVLPPGSLMALEVRDAELLAPALARHLKAHGVRYCLGLHDRMPPLEAQLPMLRALWPGDLVCRWNLQRGLQYGQAKERWAPFDRLQAPDLATRSTLARVIAATLDAGRHAFVTINNKAEGSAPASVRALAEALAARG
jgi:uncharacterized protein YecE (DUF72 family)